ncbi:nicotinamide-nucleotide adenylyltransferase [Desulfacinum hydrothermale DSM 13146]|uniref:Nicotinamide-nucleotide adenylyltransferase n=1 Tax=Desulfacinum hydrothermale DSM 13146 TaxID=1121390 RepID=A0A1W1XDG4_9BACT|nr:nicotinate-nucleotide adenylyltransferase [Desulfacinum hydrothermale]SMC21541.1 nicotinamide-nucleotide adenylyltransferase [Desulfacinum hydrothermale DSM 13146]
MERMENVGVIHGRFQILHHDHLRYLLAGKERCEHLVVGITNPEPDLTLHDPADPLRSDPASNPLTYYERQVMVRRALCEAGVALESFTLVPFPVNMPERYRYYVPLDAVFFLTLYDQWGRKKRSLFQSLGLKIHVLWERPREQKGISATEVRRRMVQGEPWKHLVPQSTAELVEQWDIVQRLRSLQHGERS